jgi:hypothetical protein
MILKNKINFLIILFFCLRPFESTAQNNKVETVDKQYVEIINIACRHFSDSIDRLSARWFVLKVFIQEAHIEDNLLKVTISMTRHKGIPSFNPTHVKETNNKIYLIRFGKNVKNEVIKALNYDIMTKAKIQMLGKLEDYHHARYITGSSPALSVFYDKNTLEKTWYDQAEKLPFESRIEDFEYLNSKIKYEVYLKKKLKEYGYK